MNHAGIETDTGLRLAALTLVGVTAAIRFLRAPLSRPLFVVLRYSAGPGVADDPDVPCQLWPRSARMAARAARVAEP